MKSNIKLIKLLNDLKKQPSDGARDLKISLNYMQKILSGKKEIPDELIHRAVKIWPINYDEFYSISDDTKNGYIIFRNEKSKKSERIMKRGGVPYYSYRDTVMSKISPFKPELIEELVTVKDNDPNNLNVKFNNGHFLHQFTYFIGPVNFYYEENNKKTVSLMNTGDSMYISPYVKHSFTTRSNKLNINGKILALTFADVLNNNSLNEVSEIGFDKIKLSKINLTNEFSTFWENLNNILKISSFSYEEILKFSKINLINIKKRKQIPTFIEIKKIAKCLNVNLRNLLPPRKFKEVEIKKYEKSRQWFFKHQKLKIYLLKELASTNLLPLVKSLEIEILIEKNHRKFFVVPSHQYIYNIGSTKVDVVLEKNKKDYLSPGDSMYIKPNTKHLFYKKGKLLVSRVNGNLSNDVVYQLSSFSDKNLKKTIHDNKPWFNKN